MAEHTTPDTATKQEEAREAKMKADAGRPPTEEEEKAAEQFEAVDPGVARAHEEAREMGARNRGEGRIP
jgi:hypothetical protein